MNILKSILIIFLGFLVSSCLSKTSENKAVIIDVAKTTAKVNYVEPKSKVVLEYSIEKEQNSKNNTGVKKTDMQDDWYWKNTLKSTNNIFENWKEGDVNIVMTHRLKGNESTPKTTIVGSIDSSGHITLNLPEKIATDSTLDNLGNLVFYDLQDIASLNYINGKTGYFATTTLNVVQNNKVIGTITLGNSVRVTYNLTNQSTLTMGDEGYLLHWVYVAEASAMEGTEIRTTKMRRDGTNTIEEQTEVVYDLNFKPGWNTVKSEIIGSYDLQHERGLNASWFKKHIHTIITNTPSDADYYFRKLSY